MFEGNWTCSTCGTTITQLPFQPRDNSNVQCRDCHQKARGDRPRRQEGDRQMYQGDWKCSRCDTAITELPFEPRDPSTLLCKECYRKEKDMA